MYSSIRRIGKPVYISVIFQIESRCFVSVALRCVVNPEERASHSRRGKPNRTVAEQTLISASDVSLVGTTLEMDPSDQRTTVNFGLRNSRRKLLCYTVSRL